ncbi:uncharacterized protein LOC144359461 [Saccoglossus kowalevskii]
MGIGSVDPVITLEHTPVEAMDSDRYLGSYATMTNKLDTEIQVRKGRASAAFAQMSKVWRSKTSLKAKLHIYNAVIIKTLRYGAEMWATTLTEEHKLDTFSNQCLRRILGV